MSTSAPITYLLDSESSNIPTLFFMIPSSSLSSISQNEKFKVNDTEKIIEVDATWKLSGLSKEVKKERGKEEGKELE